MDKAELIKNLCKERGITVNALEKELGLSTGTVLKMSKSKPNADKLYAIAKFFDVPMELFYDDQAEQKIAYYTEQIIDIMEEHRQPVYDVACGQGRANGEYADEFINIEEDSDEFTWCHAHGDSMFPKILDGDLLRVHIQTETNPKDLTVIKVNGDEATCKYVEVVSDGIWLRAENKEAFEDKFYSVQEVLSLPISIVGVVTELQRKF